MNKKRERVLWMQAFQGKLPENMRHNIEWDSAIYFYTRGERSDVAAWKYLSVRLSEEEIKNLGYGMKWKGVSNA